MFTWHCLYGVDIKLILNHHNLIFNMEKLYFIVLLENKHIFRSDHKSATNSRKHMAGYSWNNQIVCILFTNQTTDPQ